MHSWCGSVGRCHEASTVSNLELRLVTPWLKAERLFSVVLSLSTSITNYNREPITGQSAQTLCLFAWLTGPPRLSWRMSLLLLPILLSVVGGFHVHLSWLGRPMPLTPRCHSSCGVTTDFLASRFDCTEVEAKRAEEKLVPNIANTMTRLRLATQCDALQGQLGLSDPELRKVVMRLPSVLGLSFEANIEPSLAKLQGRLGLSQAELRKLVVAVPSVLGLSFEANIEPSLAKLQGRLGLSQAELRKVVMRMPSVLSYSFEANIEPSLAKLQGRLGLSEVELRKMVVALPPVLGYSFEANLSPKLDFLQSVLRLDVQELCVALQRTCSLLSVGLKRSLEPNVELWRRELQSEGLDLKAVATERGFIFLCLSFEQRTRPRMQRAREAGLRASQLISAMRYTDVQFTEWLERRRIESLP